MPLNFLNGLGDATKGIATTLMKGVGVGEFIPKDWQQPTWSEKKIKDVKEHTGAVGDFLIDGGYILGNAAPAVAASLINPALGYAVVFTGTTGQAYNEAIREGKSEEEAMTYAVILGATNTAMSIGIGPLGGSKLVSGLLKTETSKVASSLAANTLAKSTVKKYVSMGLGGMAQGYLQSIMVPAYRNMVYGENNEIPWGSKETITNTITNGIMGLAMTSLMKLGAKNKAKNVSGNIITDEYITNKINKKSAFTQKELADMTPEQRQGVMKQFAGDFAKSYKNAGLDPLEVDKQVKGMLDEKSVKDADVMQRELNLSFDETADQSIQNSLKQQTPTFNDEGINALKTKTYLTDADITSMLEKKLDFTDEQLSNMDDKQMYHVLRSLSFEAADNAKSLGKNFNNYDEILSLRDTKNVEGMKSSVKELQGDRANNMVLQNVGDGGKIPIDKQGDGSIKNQNDVSENKPRYEEAYHSNEFVLKGTQYSKEYAQKLINVYHVLKENGHSTTEHALNRIMGRISQGRIGSIEQILDVLKTGTKYKDVIERGTVIYKEGIAIHFSSDGYIKTITGKSKVKKTWEEIK